MKTEDTTGIPIEGVTFSLSMGAVSRTAETNELGIAEFSGLWPGSYVLKETAAPDPYYFDPDHETIITIVNGDGEWQEKTITNKKKCGIEVIKQDSETGALLSGAVIRAENKADPSEYYEIVTDEYGRAYFGDLKQGTFVVTETKAPAGYILSADSHEITLSPAKDLERVVLLNEPMKGTLEVMKVQSGTDTPLAGAKIVLYAPDGTAAGEGVTGEDGILSFDGLVYGSYSFRETQAPQGYVLDTSLHPAAFYITSDGERITCRFENEKAAADPGHSGSFGGSGGGSAAAPSRTAANEIDQGPAAQNADPAEAVVQNAEMTVPYGTDVEELKKELTAGSYTVYLVDKNGAVLDVQTFIIEDGDVAKAGAGPLQNLPKLGDRRDVYEYLFLLSMISLAALRPFCRKRRSKG